MVYRVPHYIAGNVYEAPHANTHDVYNPALGEVVGHVAFATRSVCDQAISEAKKAGEAWSQKTPVQRVQILFAFRSLLEKYQTDLAKLVTQEHGKTLDDAKGSVARAIEVVEHHCGLVMQLQGTFSANVASRIDCYSLRQPLGVCAGVSPFNFPVMVPIWMMIPAIACGNTFILKPSEQAPSAPIRLLELLTEAGLPAGVANAIHGDKTTVEYLLSHPDIAAFTAVASTPVAKAIYTQAVEHGKRAHTFGGAKNHGVVMPDADMQQAARAIVGAAFGSAGERCMAISVVVAVGASTAQSIISQLVPLIRAIKIDAGDIPGCDMGPLISAAQRQRVLDAIDNGVAEGAELLVDGRGFKHPTHPEGFFIAPSFFDRVTPDMSIYQQEIFGPVLVMVRVESFEQALALVNAHQYGNGTAIFTQNGFYAREYAERVQVGMIGVNIPIPVPVASHPFGGWKRSAFGDMGMHGEESVRFYTKNKSITSKWLDTGLGESLFAMPNHRSVEGI